MSKLDNYKIINDCIHGTIQVPHVVVKIIDTPQFQRLRYIKTAGSVELVYPNATHNRFQHSLGVAHLAEKFTKHIRDNCGQDHVDEKDILCVMIAGLCHDLGHGPYSHLWERFSKAANVGEGVVSHEELSIKMLDRLLEANNLRPILKELADIDETDIVFIKEMIYGPLEHQEEEDGNSVWPYCGRGEDKSFLYEIVANKLCDVDADKWDYFLRDDYYLSVGHVFDYKRFIKFCRIEEGSPGGRKRIKLRPKEAQTLDDMIHDRERLHVRGYQHPIVKIVEKMMMDAWLLADPFITIKGTDGKRLRLSESFNDMEAYERLVDEYVGFLIMESDDPRLRPAQELLRRITKREFYLDVGYFDVLKEEKLKGVKDEKILEAICHFLPFGNNKLDKEDITLVRIVVNKGIAVEKVAFYKDPKCGRYPPPPTSLANSNSSSSTAKDVLHERIIVLCKRTGAEAKEEALEAVKKWMEAEGIK